MVRTSTLPTIDEVREAVGAVPDPELPALSIAMLGMVHDVRLDEADVVVELLPTFSGCPATDVIADDVRAAVSRVEAVGAVTVRFLHDPPWTPDRINDAGHEALREVGIAPPVEAAVAPPDRPGLPTLPVLPTMAPPSVAPRPCPYCGSTNTERDGMFGPTPCRDVRWCNACRQPFEGFKS